MAEDLATRAKKAVLEALKKGDLEVHPEATRAILHEAEARPLAGAITLRFPGGEMTASWAGGASVVEWSYPRQWGAQPPRGLFALPPLETAVPENPRMTGWLALAEATRHHYERRALALAKYLLLDLPPPSKGGWPGPREILLRGLMPSWKSRSHRRPLLLWKPQAGAWELGRPSELFHAPFPFFAVPQTASAEQKALKGHLFRPGESARLLYASPFPTWREPGWSVLGPGELFAPYLGEDLAQRVERGDPEALEEAKAHAVLRRLAK